MVFVMRRAPKARNKVARGKGERSEPAAPGSPINKDSRPGGPTENYGARLSPLRGWLAFYMDPGAARFASLNAGPWLPSTAPSALGPHSVWLPRLRRSVLIPSGYRAFGARPSFHLAPPLPVRWCYTPERWRVSFKVNTRTRPSSRSSNLVTPQFALVIQTGFSSGASRAPIRCRARMQIVPV